KLLTKKSYGQHIIFREPIICPVCNTSLNVKITQSPCLLVEKRGFKNLPKVLKKIIVKNFTDHALGFIILADIAIALMLIFATNPPDHPFRSFLYETTAINAVIFLITCFVAFRYYFRPVALLFKGKNIAEKCPEIKNKLIDVILKVKLPDIFKESENCAQSEIDESYSFRHYIVENDQSDYEIMKRKQSADVPYENPCLKPGIWMLDVSC
ncbi:MAG: hypothetical protein KKD07_07865, partial [Candidatus Omnitrophica bacterium]|nr:hypothetical protein [Candidatus Omnitrophota bacterium]